MSKPSAKVFKEYLITALKEKGKTSWGKNELILFITMTYAEYLERYVES